LFNPKRVDFHVQGILIHSRHDVMRVNDAKYQQVEDPEKVADVLAISAVMVADYTGKR
jgi:hypothetical protein